MLACLLASRQPGGAANNTSATACVATPTAWTRARAHRAEACMPVQRQRDAPALHDVLQQLAGNEHGGEHRDRRTAARQTGQQRQHDRAGGRRLRACGKRPRTGIRTPGCDARGRACMQGLCGRQQGRARPPTSRTRSMSHSHCARQRSTGMRSQPEQCDAHMPAVSRARCWLRRVVDGACACWRAHLQLADARRDAAGAARRQAAAGRGRMHNACSACCYAASAHTRTPPDASYGAVRCTLRPPRRS